MYDLKKKTNKIKGNKKTISFSFLRENTKHKTQNNTFFF